MASSPLVLLVLVTLFSHGQPFHKTIKLTSNKNSWNRCRHEILFKSTPNLDQGVPYITHGKALFEQAVKHQNEGNLEEARKEYNELLLAMEEQNVPKRAMAEVYVNLGKICVQQKKYDKAKHHFELALKHRDIATAHVNLALLALSEGKVIEKGLCHHVNSSSMGPITRESLNLAVEHCEKALALTNQVSDLYGDNIDDDKVRVLAEKIMSEARIALT
jgi:tetratricopeptide (TPR) repeat protein